MNSHNSSKEQVFTAGAAEVDITPTESVFLFGYPNVPRASTGVHDPLLASALYLGDGRRGTVFVACDIIWVPRSITDFARQRIAQALDIPPAQIMITATHTHSGPITENILSNEADTIVPDPDPTYLQRLEDSIVEAAQLACQRAQSARLLTSFADSSQLGTHRRDPTGPAITKVPLLIARRVKDDTPLAVMVVCSMHPTVLHEDSTLISGDFPGLARQYVQQHVTSPDCPLVYHMGASGNQSPRHVVKAQTFDEARRLGTLLGQSIASAIDNATQIDRISIDGTETSIDLPVRQMPDITSATDRLKQVHDRFEKLQHDHAPPADVRTAECDLFGAEETLTLAKAATTGRLEKVALMCLPARVQIIRIGGLCFVGWPGEIFVEFALKIMDQFDKTFIITLASGGLQGYLVTEQAVAEGGYEASNAIFASPQSGMKLVETTTELLQQTPAKV